MHEDLFEFMFHTIDMMNNSFSDSEQFAQSQ